MKCSKCGSADNTDTCVQLQISRSLLTLMNKIIVNEFIKYMLFSVGYLRYGYGMH